MSEEEQKELLEAALRLVDAIKGKSPFTPTDLSQEIAALEKFRPAPEPRRAREWWLNVYPPQLSMSYAHDSEQSARGVCRSDGSCETVHVREVLPVEWERWDSMTPRKLYYNCPGSVMDSWEAVASAHNSAMEALAGKEGK